MSLNRRIGALEVDIAALGGAGLGRMRYLREGCNGNVYARHARSHGPGEQFLLEISGWRTKAPNRCRKPTRTHGCPPPNCAMQRKLAQSLRTLPLDVRFGSS